MENEVFMLLHKAITQDLQTELKTVNSEIKIVQRKIDSLQRDEKEIESLIEQVAKKPDDILQFFSSRLNLEDTVNIVCDMKNKLTLDTFNELMIHPVVMLCSLSNVRTIYETKGISLPDWFVAKYN